MDSVPPAPADATQRAATRFVLLTIFIDSIGFGIVIPVLPRLVMEIGRVDLAEATRIGGWLALVYAAMQFVTGPLAGNLGDRFGRRPVILLALGGFAIDYAMMAFAPTLAWLFAGRAAAGVFGASWGPATAALADITAPDDRARRFGLVSAAFGIGFIAGPAIGGLLGEYGVRAPLIAASAIALANLIYGSLAFPETLPRARRRPFDLRRANPIGALGTLRLAPGVLPLVLVMFAWTIGNMVYPATWSFFAVARYGWSTGMIGISLAWVGIIMALTQTLLLGRIVARLGERRAAMLGMVVATLGYLAYALVPGPTWTAFAILTVTALQSLVQPSLNAMMSRRVGQDQQGELQGLNASVAALGAILGPLLLNMPLAWFTRPDAPIHFPGAAFVVAAVAVTAALAMLVMLPKTKG